MRILLTSGGTKVPIDEIRDITNKSKGTFGSKIATALLNDDKVLSLDYVFAEGSQTPFTLSIDVNNPDACNFAKSESERIVELATRHRWKYSEHKFTTFKDYDRVISDMLSDSLHIPDVIVLGAAVSDYGTEPVKGKIRSGDNMDIHLVPLPKIIAGIRKIAKDALLVGFKLLVGSTDKELCDAAKSSITNNGCDIVIANDWRDLKNKNHRLFIVTKDSVELIENDPKNPNKKTFAVVEKIMQLAKDKGIQ